MKRVLLVCWFAAYLASACTVPMFYADGVAAATVFTWEDANGNGRADEGEPPIPFVTTGIAYPDALTASDGWGSASKFKPGCAAQCWKDEAVQAKVPPGFRPTTPTEYSLTGDDDKYYFGFQVDAQDEIVTFPNEPGWQRAFINRGAKVLAFHYSDSQGLEITLDRQGTVADTYYPTDFLSDRFYFDIFIFDVALELNRTGASAISALRITLMPSGDTFTCRTADVSEWNGRISGLEIIMDHCEHD